MASPETSSPAKCEAGPLSLSQRKRNQDLRRSAVDSSGDADLYRRLDAAFRRKPDSNGILQGVREFHGGRPHVRIYFVPSPKNGALIPCEGGVEAEFARHCLEVDPEVWQYRTQPFEIPGEGTPLVCDFAVKFIDHSYGVFDLKPSTKLDVESVHERMQRVREHLRRACIPHRVVTELDMEKQPACQIREQLRKGASMVVSDYGRDCLLAELRRRPMCVRELRQVAVRLGLPPLVVEKLALMGRLSFPTTVRWHELTQIGVFDGHDDAVAAGWGSIRSVRIGI